MDTREKARLARQASFQLATIPSAIRNEAIGKMAALLKAHTNDILAANETDMAAARQEGISDVLIKRLGLNEQKLDDIIASLNDVQRLPDPLGKKSLVRELDDDLLLERISTPIGVIGIIFESRPDALVQISSLCVKSGNAAILKGGSEALHTNRALFACIAQALADTDPRFSGSLHMAETREDIAALLALDSDIDLMIPRGSNELVQHIQNNTKIPVMGHADGICHVYIDKDADLEMALRITRDAKCQYPAVCNAVETLLVHADIAARFLPALPQTLADVALRGCPRTQQHIACEAATEEDWRTEYNDLVLAIRIVDSLDDAIAHINTFGSHHTDSIVTSDSAAAERFLAGVDSSSVMWNASTRFADGFRYGFGAEVGISTHRIHARGPVGLEGLVTYKYRIVGSGNIVADYASGARAFTHKTRKE
ncbi:MAG: glutamate-5-semialdehyde dehydrogenase [Proteobacteria bacterium]|nr:glutamate-5-semialdehyde dehydrogenase [Pseudomonadota bacterium]